MGCTATRNPGGAESAGDRCILTRLGVETDSLSQCLLAAYSMALVVLKIRDTAGSFLLKFFRLSLFVLKSSVKDSPGYLLRVPLGKECQLSFCIKKLENLPVGLGVVPPVSGADLVPN